MALSPSGLNCAGLLTCKVTLWLCVEMPFKFHTHQSLHACRLWVSVDTCEGGTERSSRIQVVLHTGSGWREPWAGPQSPGGHRDTGDTFPILNCFPATPLSNGAAIAQAADPPRAVSTEWGRTKAPGLGALQIQGLLGSPRPSALASSSGKQLWFQSIK